MDRTAPVSPADTACARMPQLDSLRAFAIGGVMLQHFHYPQLNRFVPFWLGVQLFFVLSGFLITGILVRGQPTAKFIGGFYLRRGLRLFPLYFLVVAIIAVFSQELRDAWPYYTFYGVNFWVAKNMQWGVATHFWTLGVEEQFYLLWPLVVLFTPRRLLAYFCVSLIPIALAFRVAMQVLAHNDFGVVLLPGSVDSLACGALLRIKKTSSSCGRQRASHSRLSPFFPTLMDHQCRAAALCYPCLRGSARLRRHVWTCSITAVASVYRSNFLWNLRHPPSDLHHARLLSVSMVPAIAPEYLGLGRLCYCHFRACDAVLALHRKSNQPPPRPSCGRSLQAN